MTESQGIKIEACVSICWFLVSLIILIHHKTKCWHLRSYSSDGLMLMMDDLSGPISELSFAVLHVSGPMLSEMKDRPLRRTNMQSWKSNAPKRRRRRNNWQKSHQSKNEEQSRFPLDTHSHANCAESKSTLTYSKICCSTHACTHLRIVLTHVQKQ